MVFFATFLTTAILALLQGWHLIPQGNYVFLPIGVIFGLPLVGGLYLLFLTILESAKDKGTQYLIKDMEYLNYFPIYNSPNKTSVFYINHIAIDPDRKHGKAYNRVFAFFAYRADILNLFKKTTANMAEQTRLNNGTINSSDFKYINKNLRAEVDEAIKLEKMLVRNGTMYLRPDAPFTIASYIFSNRREGQVDLDSNRLNFFYRNDYSPESVYKLRDIELSQLESFEGVPSSWVCAVFV